MQKVIEDGIKYIASQQQDDGGFASQHTQDPVQQYQTTFIVSNIIQALDGIPKIGDIQDRAVDWLLLERSDDWSFNFWSKRQIAESGRKYSDDLDDTFSALSAICIVKPEAITGEAFALILKLLFASEYMVGGPYYTWLEEVHDKPMHKIDQAVNATILRFLHLHNAKTEQLVDYLAQEIKKGDLDSQFYNNPIVVCYFLSRCGWVDTDVKQVLVTFILNRRGDNNWGNYQNAAMAGSALLNLGYEPSKLDDIIGIVSCRQQNDGSWEGVPFCVDGHGLGGKVEYTYAHALTTALCIEFLHKQRMQDHVGMVDNESFTPVIRGLSEIQTSLSAVQARLAEKDTLHTIKKLPSIINAIFEARLDDRELHRAAEMGVWGWTAYTIYDDFLDDAGDAVLMPAAHIAMRRLVLSIDAHRSLSFRKHSLELLDKIDEANAWEVRHTRVRVNDGRFSYGKLPQYGSLDNLANRSIGYMIPSLSVMYSANFLRDSIEIQSIEDFFYHFLIARQIGDDMHDWEVDLQNGHISFVLSKLLHVYGKPVIEFEKDMQKLRSVFWNDVVDDIVTIQIDHVTRARRFLKQIPSAYDPKPLVAMLDSVVASIDRLKSERTTIKEFLAAF